MQEKERLVLSQPRDETLEAYKDWVLQTYEFLTGKDRTQAPIMTEEQLRSGWLRFWQKLKAQSA